MQVGTVAQWRRLVLFKPPDEWYNTDTWSTASQQSIFYDA